MKRPGEQAELKLGSVVSLGSEHPYWFEAQQTRQGIRLGICRSTPGGEVIECSAVLSKEAAAALAAYLSECVRGVQ